jgi:hypothetical protein
MSIRAEVFNRLDAAFRGDAVTASDVRALLVAAGFRQEMGEAPEQLPASMLAPLSPDEIEECLAEGRLLAVTDSLAT